MLLYPYKYLRLKELLIKSLLKLTVMSTARGAHPVLRIPLPHVVDVPSVRAALNVKLVRSVRNLSNFLSVKNIP